MNSQLTADLATLRDALEATPRGTPVNKTAEGVRGIMLWYGRRETADRLFIGMPASWRHAAVSKRALDAILAEFFTVVRSDRSGRPITWERK